MFNRISFGGISIGLFCGMVAYVIASAEDYPPVPIGLAVGGIVYFLVQYLERFDR
jgi:hypothetical protein